MDEWKKNIYEGVSNALASRVLCPIGDMLLSLEVEENIVPAGSVYSSAPHEHRFFEIHYLRNGEMDFSLSNKHSFTLQDGSLCVVPPGMVHAYHNSDGSLHHVMLSFTVKRVKKISDSPFSEFDHYSAILRRITETQMISVVPLYALLEQIRALFPHHEGENEHALKAYGAVFFIELCTILAAETPLLPIENARGARLFDRTQRKWQIENYILSNYMVENPIEGLMDTLHLSRRQTIRVVCQLMGESPAELITKQRIATAQDFIRNSTLTLEEIAGEVGYRSYSGFYNAVRKICDTTPEQLARDIRGE